MIGRQFLFNYNTPMNKQSKYQCDACGMSINESHEQHPNRNCPQCGHAIESAQQAVNHSRKAGPMPHRQLILMMVLLPLLVVVMTVGSWYLIKAYRLPSVQVESQSDLMESESVTTAKNSTLQPLIFIKK